MASGVAPPKQARGFTYIVVLVAVAISAWAASAALQLGALAGRRDAERALLAAGFELEQALYSYAGVPWPNGAPPTDPQTLRWRGPREMDELLRDPRVAGVRRHLRRLRSDPMTGQLQWGILRDHSNHIVGFYSLAHGRPIQQTAFDPPRAHFESADSYQRWVFGLPVAPLIALQGPDHAGPKP